MCPLSHDLLFIHLCHGVREGPSPLPHLGNRSRLIGSLVRKRLPLVIHYPSHITLSLVWLLCYLMCTKSPQTPVFTIDPYQPLWPISLIGEVANNNKKSLIKVRGHTSVTKLLTTALVSESVWPPQLGVKRLLYWHLVVCHHGPFIDLSRCETSWGQFGFFIILP